MCAWGAISSTDKRGRREHRGRINVELIIGLLGALLGTAVGALATLLTGRAQMRRELQYSYDRELRTRRMDSYASLYRQTGNMPRYWTNHPARSLLSTWASGLVDWYFREAGGLYLSDPARDAYLSLFEVMATIANHDSSGERLSEDEVQRLWRAGQALRRQLAADIGAAEDPQLRGRHPSVSPPPQTRFKTLVRDDYNVREDARPRPKATQ
jgi:hypothetical protein